jgi:hypothetical protein
LTPVESLAATFNVHEGVTYEVQMDALPTVRWRRPYRDMAVTIQDTGDETTDRAAAEDLIRCDKPAYRHAAACSGARQNLVKRITIQDNA